MNSTELNKIAGAMIGALLIFLLLNFFSGMVYDTREEPHHEGDPLVLAFALPVETDGAAAPEAEAQVDYAALVAQADPAAGEGLFRACAACHNLEDGANAVGPHLYDVVGRDIAGVSDYSYSDALAAVEGDWTLTDLSAFLENPKTYAPGTKMAYAGMKDPQDRVDLIAYLNQVGDTPVDLSAGLEPVAAAAEQPAEELPPAEAAAIRGQDLAAGVSPMTPLSETGVETPAPGTGIPSVNEAADIEAPVTGIETTGVEIVDTTEEAFEVESTVPVEITEEPGLGADDELTPVEEEAAEQEMEGEPVPGLEDAAPELPATEAPVTEAPAVVAPVTEAPVVVAPATEAPAPAAPAPAAPAPAAEAPAAAPAGEMLAGDVAAGEAVFRRCRACHKIEEGANGIGPHLYGVVGRPVASVEGFSYSDALVAHGGEWTPERLSEYLENPRAAVPGNKMAFPGLKDEQDRIDVITYLQQASGS